MSANDTNTRPSNRARSYPRTRQLSPAYLILFLLAAQLRAPHALLVRRWQGGGEILITRNIHFRIYGDLLATHSTLFVDMFASASAGADEAFEGCLVVHLYDVDSHVALLRILLPSSSSWCMFRPGASISSF